MENLMTAFDVAEKHLDIPKMLDPEGKYGRAWQLGQARTCRQAGRSARTQSHRKGAGSEGGTEPTCEC